MSEHSLFPETESQDACFKQEKQHTRETLLKWDAGKGAGLPGKHLRNCQSFQIVFEEVQNIPHTGLLWLKEDALRVLWAINTYVLAYF